MPDKTTDELLAELQAQLERVERAVLALAYSLLELGKEADEMEKNEGRKPC